MTQERFEDAVLEVVREVLSTERRVDLVVDGLGVAVPADGDTDVRADMIICAAECVRLVTTLPGGRASIIKQFPAFAAACRALPPSPGSSRTTRIEAALKRFVSAFLGFPRIRPSGGDPG